MARARKEQERQTAHEQTHAPSAPLPKIESPIVPHQSIGGRALVAVVAIMTYLASLTTGAVMLVRANAAEWQTEILREVTIQIRPGAGRDLDAAVKAAAEIARSFDGISEVRPYTKEESARLLEPWLGSRAGGRRLAGAARDRGQACLRRNARCCQPSQDADRQGSGCLARRSSWLD